MFRYLKQAFVTKKDKRIGYLLVSLFAFYAIVALLMTLDIKGIVYSWSGLIVILLVGIPVFLLDMYVIDSQNERIKAIATLPCFLFTLVTLYPVLSALIVLFWGSVILMDNWLTIINHFL